VLPQNRRLKTPKLFKRALASTPFFRGRYFVVFLVARHPDCLPQNRRPTAFGIIISKKVDKRAAVRNRIKRWLREAIRQTVLPCLLPAVADAAGVVILVRQASTEADYHLLNRELVAALTTPRVQASTMPPSGEMP